MLDVKPPLQIDRDRVAALCRKRGIDLLLLHGSRVAGATHAESDTDVGYVCREGRLSAIQSLDLQRSLGEILGTDDVDLVDLQRVPGLLRHLAGERGILLFEARPGEHEAFRVLAFDIYQDERIQIRRHDAAGLRCALERLQP
jgi:predicted nucleotidyltransferase